MTHPLAIFVPELGVISQTFIRRHVCDLLPGGTVAVVDRVSSSPAWRFEGLWREGTRRNEALLTKALYRLGLGRSPVIEGVRGFLREQGVDTILGEYLGYSHRWLGELRGEFRFFVHAHGHDVSRQLRERKWRRLYLDYAGSEGVITMSDFSRRALVEIGLPREKLHVVPYGVDVPDEPPAQRPGGPVRCFAVGRMVGKKAPVLLLRSFARALRRPGVEAVLEYVGDGPLFEAAREYVREHGLEERVILHGARPNEFVRERMAAAHIFVQHSRVDPEDGDMEGLPVAILEAMAAGLPVVSTRHAGIPEAVEEGVTGLLVDEGDWEGMGEGLAELLADEPARRQMGEAAWQRARARFSWPVERRALLEVMGLG